MKLCILSDSHMAQDEVKRVALIEQDCDAFVHLGDFVMDAEELAKQTEKPVYMVRGNCDWGSRKPAELLLELEGVKLLMCHGHERRVKDTLYPLVSRANEVGAKVALFGHTHTPLSSREDDILLLNPGALADRRYALLTILPDGTLLPELKRLQSLYCL